MSSAKFHTGRTRRKPKGRSSGQPNGGRERGTMKILSPETINELHRKGWTTEYVTNKQYTRAQAIKRAGGSIPRDLTPNGEIVLEIREGVSLDTGRTVNRFMVVSLVRPKAGGAS